MLMLCLANSVFLPIDFSEGGLKGDSQEFSEKGESRALSCNKVVAQERFASEINTHGYGNDSRGWCFFIFHGKELGS